MIRSRRAAAAALAAIVVYPSADAGRALQAAYALSMSSGRPVELLAGDYIVKNHAAAGQDQFQALLGGSGASWGAGKTLVIRGVPGKTVIRGGVASEHFFRFTASRANPMTLIMRDIVVEAGALASARPMMNIRNCTVAIENVDLRGSYDLTVGGGWTLVGNVSGWMNNCGAYNVSTAFVNVGTGLDTGAILEEGQHANSLNIHRFRGRNCVGHGINIHGSYDCSITECNLYHAIEVFGYPKSNAGLRGGNGGRRIRWVDNVVYGFYRGCQIHDYVIGLIADNIFSQCGSPGLSAGGKDYPNSGLRIENNIVENCARLVGRVKPASDSDDPDSDEENSVGAEAVAYLINGFKNLSLSGSAQSDLRDDGMGTITCTAGGTTATLVDPVFQGNHHNGLSRNFLGDIVYLNDDGDTPSFNFRLHPLNGIGPRVYKTNPDGSGVVMDTVAYRANPPTRVQEELIVATITSVSLTNPAVFTSSAPHGINNGKNVFVHGFSSNGMTQLADGWRTITVLSPTTFHIGVNMSTGYSAYDGSGGIVQQGPGAITQVLTADAPILHSMTNDAFQVRRLEERFETIGVSNIPGMPPATGGTLAWVPWQEPMYFNPGPAGSTITVDTTLDVVTGASGSAFDTWILPRLADSPNAVVVLNGLVDGRMATLGVAKVDAGNDGITLKLTSNGLRNYTGPWWFTVENKMRYAFILGDMTPAENRARRCLVDRAMAIRGQLINYGHTYIECIASGDRASFTWTIPAQTISAEKRFLSRLVLPRGRQRLGEVTFAFAGEVPGDSVDCVLADIERIRQGAATAITGMTAIPLTDEHRDIGERINVAGPPPSNDEIPEADLFRVNEQDHLGVRLYPKPAGAGGAITDLLVTETMEWW